MRPIGILGQGRRKSHNYAVCTIPLSDKEMSAHNRAVCFLIPTSSGWEVAAIRHIPKTARSFIVMIFLTSRPPKIWWFFINQMKNIREIGND